METAVVFTGESRTDLALAVMLAVIVGGQLLLVYGLRVAKRARKLLADRRGSSLSVQEERRRGRPHR